MDQILSLMAGKVQVSRRKKKLLITGGAGFIGLNFLKKSKILENYNVSAIYKSKRPSINKNVVFIKADLTNIDECKCLFSDYDVIFHCAGIMMTSSTLKRSPLQGLMDNLRIHLNVIDSITQKPPEKFIWLSSTTGYPLSNKPLIELDYFLNEVPTRYEIIGQLYRLMEKTTSTILNQKCKIITLRPTGVFGEGDDFRPESSHILPKIIREASLEILPEVIYAQKEEMRNWLYVGDLIKAIDSVLENVDFNVTLNLGSEKSTSMYELYLIILKFFGIERKHFIDASNIFPLAPMARHIDCNLSIKYLGKYNSTSLARGLKNTINWYKNVYSK